MHIHFDFQQMCFKRVNVFLDKKSVHHNKTTTESEDFNQFVITIVIMMVISFVMMKSLGHQLVLV